MRLTMLSRLGALVVGSAVGAALLPASAVAGSDSGEAPAVALLARAAAATRSQPYSGTEFLSSWTAVGTASAVVEVAHLPGRGSLTTVRPTGSMAGSTRFDGEGELAGLSAEPLALLRQNYDVRLAGSQQCVGRAAEVVDVRRRPPAGTLAGRFWLDHQSGLVLRREVFDSTGRVVWASSFVQVDLTAPSPAPGQPLAAVASDAGQRLDGDELTGLRSTGYAIPSQLPHELALYDARSRTQAGRPVVQLSYSDGLSTLSLFEQRGRFDPASLPGWHRQQLGRAQLYLSSDLPQRVVWAGPGIVYTMVGDAPAETVRAAVTSLPARPRPAHGLWTRLRRGLARLASWL